MEYPEITMYKIIYMPRYAQLNKTYSHICSINHEIFYYGLHRIRKIVFYFKTMPKEFPYGIHPIILEKEKERFRVVLYHYYNAKNQRMEMYDEQQQIDYKALIAYLMKHSNLLMSYLEPKPTISI